MKALALFFAALPLASAAIAQSTSAQSAVATSNSSMLVKMTSSLSSSSSKPGEEVRGVLIDPAPLRGSEVIGKVIRADHAILNFSFDTIRISGTTIPIESRLVSITSSKGNEGRDDLDNRIRIEGVGIIAFGTATALDEGAEVRITAWKK